MRKVALSLRERHPRTRRDPDPTWGFAGLWLRTWRLRVCAYLSRSERATLCLSLLLVGCGQTPSAQPIADDKKPEVVAPATGTITGRVVWDGDAPNIPVLKVVALKPGALTERPNPNTPIVNAKNGGIEQAIVFLRHVDSPSAWPHAPVRVVFDDGKLTIHQGDRKGRVGFVRRGDDFTCVALEKKGHHLVGRGADHFALPLFETNRESQRTAKKSGLIELSSGAGLYWLRGHLWVGDHPHVAVTDADGAFRLPDAPVGKQEVVCLLPSWKHRLERNPETGEIERLAFDLAVEQVQSTMVNIGATAKLNFTWRTESFTKKAP